MRHKHAIGLSYKSNIFSIDYEKIEFQIYIYIPERNMFNPVSYVINLITSLKKLYSAYYLNTTNIQMRLLEAEKLIEQLDLIVYDNSIRLSKLEKSNSNFRDVVMTDASTQTTSDDIKFTFKVSKSRQVQNKCNPVSGVEIAFKEKAAARKKHKTRFTPYRSAKNKALVAFKVQSASI